MSFHDGVEWFARPLDHSFECEYDLENGVAFVPSCYYKPDVDWVRLKIQDNEIYHIARIAQLPQSSNQNTHHESRVFLSPILFFNLLDASKKCSFGLKDDVPVQISIDSKPNLADEVHLSLCQLS